MLMDSQEIRKRSVVGYEERVLEGQDDSSLTLWLNVKTGRVQVESKECSSQQRLYSFSTEQL